MPEWTTEPGELSPIGLYIHGLEFLDAAEVLKREQEGRKSAAFEFPLRSLYSHAWESVLKACLMKQGWSFDGLKRVGHDLERAYDEVDLDRFGALQLANAAAIIPILNVYHRSRFYFYPGTGQFPMLLMNDLSQWSERLRLERRVAAEVFGLPF